LHPNGAFYLTNSKEAKIETTSNFVTNKNIKYATQSGPMLLINGVLHSKFNKSSKNLNIRYYQMDSYYLQCLKQKLIFTIL